MRGKLLDLSDRLDEFTLEVIKLIHNTSRQLNIDYFIIGATARDIIFEKQYGIKVQRATNDIDFSIRAGSWDDYKMFVNKLLESGFEQSRVSHRFNYKNIPSIDLIPFGGISIDETVIRWPEKESGEMTVLGFTEALENSELVKVSGSPDVIIKIASVASLVMLKLISWKDAYPTRSRDASDILFIAKNYTDAGNLDRLVNNHSDIMEIEPDYELWGSRLLGRDISRIAKENTRQHLIKLLAEETDENNQLKLVQDMIAGDYLSDTRNSRFEFYLKIVKSMFVGIKEGKI